MIRLKAVSTAAAVALVLAMVPPASFAQDRGGNGSYGRGAFIPGSVAGAVGFYDNGYYDFGGGAAAVTPTRAGAEAHCRQAYRSYDPRSGTYVGHDGYRHPCR